MRGGHIEVEVGSSGKTIERKADSTFSLPKVPLVSADDTAPYVLG